MGWAKESFILILLLASSFAADTLILTGQENTTQFAIDTSAARCADSAAVYACSGNVVKAVSADGTIAFYKPDGKVVKCPKGTPSQMGAECMYMLTPNFCKAEVACETPARPAANASGQGNASGAAPFPPPAQAPVKAAAKPAPKENVVIPAPVPAAADFSLDGLALVVLALGAVSVGVLFTMFKNSISE